jgi:hypothetical protein
MAGYGKMATLRGGDDKKKDEDDKKKKKGNTLYTGGQSRNVPLASYPGSHFDFSMFHAAAA